jgi:hypothetical protein
MATKFTGSVVVHSGDITENSSVQNHPLGSMAITDDGRIFRYCKAGGTTLVAGKLQQAPAIVANHQNLACTAASAGATSVTVTLGATAATANQYAEGYLVINDVDGEGYTYKIKSHPAADASATLTLTLEDPLFEALTANSEACLIANPYNGVIVAPASASSSAVGVALKEITNGQYGWLVTHGVTSCLSDGAVSVGAALSPSNAVAGAVESGVIGQGVVGQALQAGVDTEYRAVFITID